MEKAAEQGYTEVQYAIGNCYRDDTGVEKNRPVTYIKFMGEREDFYKLLDKWDAYFTGAKTITDLDKKGDGEYESASAVLHVYKTERCLQFRETVGGEILGYRTVLQREKYNRYRITYSKPNKDGATLSFVFRMPTEEEHQTIYRDAPWCSDTEGQLLLGFGIMPNDMKVEAVCIRYNQKAR